MTQFPKDLLSLINYLKKLPGVGSKTAQRYAFSLLNWDEEMLDELANLIKQVRGNNPPCVECGCLMHMERCNFCQSESRGDTLCILSSPKEVYSFEEMGTYRGLYHIVDHLLSPLDGYDESGLDVERIKKRIIDHKIKEVIVALDATIEGDATALYIKQELEKIDVHISRLAFGLPIGSSLEYIDAGTLSRALSGRQSY